MEGSFWFMASVVSVHCHLSSLFLGHSEVEHYTMRMWRRATYPIAARKPKERPREQEWMIDKTNTSRPPFTFLQEEALKKKKTQIGNSSAYQHVE